MTSSTESFASGVKWSASTLGCVEKTLGEVAELARQTSLTGVELRGVEGRMDLPALWAEQFAEPAALREHLSAIGLRVFALDSSFKLIGSPGAARAELLAFGEWAEGIGVPYIRVFDGGHFVSPLAPDDLREAVENLSWWKAERQQRGWRTDIMVETHDALCTGANCRALWEAAGQPVSILWDAHHTWRKAGEPLDVTWAAIQEHVPHIHYKDSVDQPSARHPFSYTHLGEGQFPLGELARLLKESAYTGVLSLEWERQWHPYLPPLHEALQHPGYAVFQKALGTGNG